MNVYKDLFKIAVKNSNTAMDKYYAIHIILKQKHNPITKHEENQINFIRKIRNDLIHFEPKLVVDLQQKAYDDYKKYFDKEFTLSPFFHKGFLFLPNRCLSSSFAGWCLKIVKQRLMAFDESIQHDQPIAPQPR